ncbi:hypothetical protein B5S32_g5173 [[Candida] boidinii]|nr:hypothetical protein B5S32_g5173 [[Candida] boidinii]
MCISSYLSGLIPLSFDIDLKNLKFISILSVGILISTSFIIIIPESIETLNSNNQDEKSIGIYLLIGFTTLFVLDRVGDLIKDYINNINNNNNNNNNIENDYSLSNFEIDADHDDDESTLRPNSSSSIGFVNPFTNFSGSSDKRPISHMIKSVFQSTNTVGLMIHSITDGIALASSFLGSGDNNTNSSSSSSSSSSFLIIIAIFLHKLPTAFALTSIMLESKNYSKREIRYHLLFFSISAPIGSILILIINLNLSELSGILLSISGGSFIFVGFHSLHEMINRLDKNNNKDKSILESSFEFLLCLIGLFIPVLISFISSEDV